MLELIGLTDDELHKYAPDFWHTSEWKNYCLLSGGVDCTLAIHENKKVRAIIPLIRERSFINERNEDLRQVDSFTFQQSYCPKILLEDNKYLGKIPSILKKHAKDNGVHRIVIEGYIPSFKHYVVDMCIADLSCDVPIRSGYRPLICKAKKELNVVIVNDQSDFQEINRLVNIIQIEYYEIAKGIFRPVETFERYKSWIKKGYASLFIAYKGIDIVGFTLVTHYKLEAYYFLCGVVAEYKKLNVSHYLQAEIIEYLRKERGVVRYVLGDVSSLYHNCSNDCNSQEISAKEKNIAFFKSGFGDSHKYKVVSECVL